MQQSAAPIPGDRDLFYRTLCRLGRFPMWATSRPLVIDAHHAARPAVVCGSTAYKKLINMLPLRRVRYGAIYGPPIDASDEDKAIEQLAQGSRTLYERLRERLTQGFRAVYSEKIPNAW